MITVFSAMCTFIIANKSAIATNVIASATYDTLKTILDFSLLKKRIKKFFKSEEDTENYLEKICSTPAKNIKKPDRDVVDSFEELTGEKFNKQLYNEIVTWIKENSGQIEKLAYLHFENKSGINIGTQTAGKNIFNIQGDYNSEKH